MTEQKLPNAFNPPHPLVENPKSPKGGIKAKSMVLTCWTFLNGLVGLSLGVLLAVYEYRSSFSLFDSLES